jgi:hypothetical protein
MVEPESPEEQGTELDIFEFIDSCAQTERKQIEKALQDEWTRLKMALMETGQATSLSENPGQARHQHGLRESMNTLERVQNAVRDLPLSRPPGYEDEGVEAEEFATADATDLADPAPTPTTRPCRFEQVGTKYRCSVHQMLVKEVPPPEQCPAGMAEAEGG